MEQCACGSYNTDIVTTDGVCTYKGVTHPITYKYVQCYDCGLTFMNSDQVNEQSKNAKALMQTIDNIQLTQRSEP